MLLMEKFANWYKKQLIEERKSEERKKEQSSHKIPDVIREYRDQQLSNDREKEQKQKEQNSNNPGEKAVAYAIKWICAASENKIISVNNDCESNHSFNCILLNKPDFIDEPQEYDHILLCPAGVVLIETKHWKGTVNIRPDGKWTRKKDEDSTTIGVESPKFQMRRHELLMQKILPEVPVHSILCFSNASTIIEGKEYFKDYPIVSIDQLEETLANICNEAKYSDTEITQMVKTIEDHKVRKEQ